MSAPSSAIVDGVNARRLLQTHLFDRVSVLAGRLDYALVPASVYSDLGIRNGTTDVSNTTPSTSASSPTKIGSIDLEGAALPTNSDEVYVCVDEHLVYARFFADFGPLDLGQTVRFCREITSRLSQAGAGRIVLFSSDHPHKRANVMTLVALFLVLCHGASPEQAIAPFRTVKPAFGFRDAACGICTFFTSTLDCARAVYKAQQTSMWDFAAFSLDDYEHYDQLHHGDINWIVPGKLIAFSGPQRERIVLDHAGHTTLLAHEYAQVFRKLGVTCVVRFNEPSTYDRKAFLQANIRHLDMEYPDGGNPPDDILLKFLRTCEREPGAIAVHCKAGLGRTGTNIAAFIIKKFGFTAAEAIAWCRICRPGSIVGPQQQYLIVQQPRLWQLAADGDQPQKQRAQAFRTQVSSVGTTPTPLATKPRKQPLVVNVPTRLPTPGKTAPSNAAAVVVRRSSRTQLR